ncbi:MAG TPA: hypothetical protein DCQ98_13480 [Planctomycetaceae bacterium]|nr:hypothetical protein [Planctomycetaceae bacterium]
MHGNEHVVREAVGEGPSTGRSLALPPVAALRSASPFCRSGRAGTSAARRPEPRRYDRRSQRGTTAVKPAAGTIRRVATVALRFADSLRAVGAVP